MAGIARVLTEINHGISSKRKYSKDNPEAVKRRNSERKEREVSPQGKINFSAKSRDEIDFVYDQAKKIKTFLGEGNHNLVTNKQLLEAAFSYYIEKNIDSVSTEIFTDDASNVNIEDSYNTCDSSFCKCETSNECDQPMFVASESAVEKLCDRLRSHNLSCSSPVHKSDMKMIGHVAFVTFRCEKDHVISWPSSPYLGTKYLVNVRMCHGYSVSGILPNQYDRFAQAANIGKLGSAYISEVFSDYKDVVCDLSRESCEDALLEEIVKYPDMDGINILTDARHGTRKNSRFTDVVCIGANTHKIIRTETVSKVDNVCTQKHELIGTQRVYDYLDSVDNGVGVHVKLHCHDRNHVINKYIREERPDTTSTNDTWHATKNVTKEIKSVCLGPKYKEGVTWHRELSDKAGSIKTHFYWCIRNCDQDADNLRDNIMNVVNHYKGIHDNCSISSRCRSDAFYEPSKLLITDPKAELLLCQALKSTVVYKNTNDYVHCMDTFFVESFNNSLLQYHNKRINFSEDVYRFRTSLAILDWNEHVNRPATSTKFIMDAKNPRRQAETKVLKRKTYNMWDRIWKEYVAIFLE